MPEPNTGKGILDDFHNRGKHVFTLGSSGQIIEVMSIVRAVELVSKRHFVPNKD